MDTLFEPENRMPYDLFTSFKACNDAPRSWMHKQVFYEIKKSLLNEFGCEAGYDRQIIVVSCNACHLGVFERFGQEDEMCYYCHGTGIYQTRVYMLKRWVLNGELFYTPEHGYNGRYISTIRGYVPHPIPSQSPDYSIFYLMSHYLPDHFNLSIKSFSKTLKKNDWKLWGEYARQSNSIIDCLAKYYGVGPSDDLPF